MSSKVFGVTINCDNDLELVTTMVRLYADSINLRHNELTLRPKTTKLLAFYVKFGYSKDTKQKAAASLETSAQNINVMNLELTKSGFLITSDRNHHQKYLNDELKALAAYVDAEATDKLFVFKVKKG